MNESNKDKIYKIYNAIKKLDDTGNIYEILRTMDIPKTMNSNGIFVNLKCLGEDQIKVLYETSFKALNAPKYPNNRCNLINRFHANQNLNKRSNIKSHASQSSKRIY